MLDPVWRRFWMKKMVFAFENECGRGSSDDEIIFL